MLLLGQMDGGRFATKQPPVEGLLIVQPQLGCHAIFQYTNFIII